MGGFMWCDPPLLLNHNEAPRALGVEIERAIIVVDIEAGYAQTGAVGAEELYVLDSDLLVIVLVLEDDSHVL